MPGLQGGLEMPHCLLRIPCGEQRSAHRVVGCGIVRTNPQRSFVLRDGLFELSSRQQHGSKVIESLKITRTLVYVVARQRFLEDYTRI